MEKRRYLELLKERNPVAFEKFDFSKLENSFLVHSRQIFICPKHGELSLLPYSLFNTNGCRKCGHETRVHPWQITKEMFVKESQALFGKRFDFTKTIYIFKKHLGKFKRLF